MKLYGLKSCDTCKKALKALTAADRPVSFVDVRSDGVPKDQLKRFHDTFGDAIVNKKSKTWRELDDAAQQLDVVDLLVTHPLVMKRPVIDNGSLYLGWAPDVQKELTS
ncbi:arsenate reductase family protein [Pseudaestuariivita rosea]|uniref:arsenate reductase family protein n=1 Tax=Pseudaestuariivita rosea TaxID=2763263 RepID=UPI001ABA7A8E|nr:ArsC/Spx/MgsR family protein [Pseudaestuariivita rosea]